MFVYNNHEYFYTFVKNISIMKKFLILSLTLVMIASCINPRKYDDLTATYNKTTGNLRDCRDSSRFLLSENIRLVTYSETQEKHISMLRADSIEIHSLYQKKIKLYDDLNDTYERLLKNTNTENQQYKGSLKDREESLKERERKLRDQEDAMSKKDAANASLKQDLDLKQKSLDKALDDLEKREQRVKELESTIRAKDSATMALKNSISQALTGFTGNGLTVETRDGKVYVSLDEQLLLPVHQRSIYPLGVYRPLPRLVNQLLYPTRTLLPMLQAVHDHFHPVQHASVIQVDF